MRKNFLLFLCIFLSAPILCSCVNEVVKFETKEVIEAQEETEKKLQLTETEIGALPVITIETQNGVLPYDKETYINCSFKIENCENEEENFTVSMKDEWGEKDSVGIRLRGNSTLGVGHSSGKFPYRIKFDKKKSLFGLEKAKSWVLLADYLDQSSVRNYTGFYLANLISQTYEDDNTWFAPTAHHVVLYVNDECKGLYLLCEQVDEKEGRTNVEEAFDTSLGELAFLVEMDRNALNEGIYGIETYQVEGMPYPIELKFPEFSQKNDTTFNLIIEYLETVFYLLKNGGTKEVSFAENPVALDDLIDEQSLIDWFLVNEIMHNQDALWDNIYFYKAKNGKMKMGPVWDFDWSMSKQFIVPYTKSYIEVAYSSRFINEQDAIIGEWIKQDENWNKFCVRWNEVKGYVLETVEHLRTYKNLIDLTAIKDAIYYYGENGEFQFDMQYDYVRLFLLDRYNFLDDYLTEKSEKKQRTRCFFLLNY